MLLGNLLKLKEDRYNKISIKGIADDSRKVKRKYIFFAIKGNQTTGTKFINQAILNGASAIVSEDKIKKKLFNTHFIKVKNVRKSLALACSNFYKEKPKNIIAVTGTNGKSSVVGFFYQILVLNKIPVGSIGTLGLVSKKFNKKTSLTSIDPISLHKNLQFFSKKKINNLILEASSHGLDQNRLDNLNIKIGIFTNLSHDHLDYHKNIRSYFKAKLYLFNKLLGKKSTVITDKDIKEYKTIKKITKRRSIKIKTIGKNNSSIKILNHENKEDVQLIKILFNSKIYDLEVPLIGYFQVKNLLMSVIAAHTCGIKIEKILNKIKKIKPISGRLECVAKVKKNSRIIIDFAHTPDALEQSLTAIKKQFRKKIIIVFGCGGDRDKKKRYLMGKVAKKYCRKIFITDDNPRNENPKKIRNSIIRGCKNKAVNIADRKKAIKLAIKELGLNEILLVAGKGHEQTQDFGNKVINFSDKKVIKNLVLKNKLLSKKINYHDFLLKKISKQKLKNIKYTGVSINTKTIKKNNLFFAIKGKKTDGHKFVNQAIYKGAIKSFVNKKINRYPEKKVVLVKNTLLSLNQLAKVTRENTMAKIIGITGSVGKTTLKNLISFSLKRYGNVYHSPHSYNNKFGVPLSVSNLKENTNFGVFEIGMDKKGEINTLSKIVKPELAIITNIAEAHIQNFNTLKDIAKAKAEIINNIDENGNLILNKDDKFFRFLSSVAEKKGIKIISFSVKRKADIFLKNIIKLKNYNILKIKVKNNIYFLKTSNNTKNFINNLLACVSTLYALNLNLKLIKNIFYNFIVPSGRGDIKIVKKFNKKFKFIDESYNANPLSMSSAIENMNLYKRKTGEKKIILLGDMLELGKKSKKLHRKLSQTINKSDVDKVFVYGKYIKETYNLLYNRKKGKICNNLNEAYYQLSKIIHNNDLLMIKGSNATGLNQFSKNIKKDNLSAL
tara:strand:- start:19094 stop:21940 length:2847 start_codon:yes stop_codon:yes gene_type:complete